MNELKNMNQQKRNISKINIWKDINISQNKENLFPNNDKLKRFRKRVILISKRNNININPNKNNDGKLNIFTSYGGINNNNNNMNNKNFNINKINTNSTKSGLKENRSIQNIFYNTYYNCLFDKKYNITNTNDYINNSNSNNNEIIKNKYSYLKRSKEIKSLSSEKNLFNHKKIFNI